MLNGIGPHAMNETQQSQKPKQETETRKEKEERCRSRVRGDFILDHPYPPYLRSPHFAHPFTGPATRAGGLGVGILRGAHAVPIPIRKVISIIGLILTRFPAWSS